MKLKCDVIHAKEGSLEKVLHCQARPIQFNIKPIFLMILTSFFPLLLFCFEQKRTRERERLFGRRQRASFLFLYSLLWSLAILR